jgi:hypothetical protein
MFDNFDNNHVMPAGEGDCATITAGHCGQPEGARQFLFISGISEIASVAPLPRNDEKRIWGFDLEVEFNISSVPE